MSGLGHLDEERAEELKQQLATRADGGESEVTYRLNVTGRDGLDVTEFRIKDFTSLYAEDVAGLLDEELIVSLGFHLHLDGDYATLSVVSPTAREGVFYE